MKLELIGIIIVLILICICALLEYKRSAKTLAHLEKLSQENDDVRAQVRNYEKEVMKVISQFKEENERLIFEPYYIYVPSGAEIVSNLGSKLNEGSFYLIVFEKDGKGELLNGEGWIDLDKVYKNPQPILPRSYTFSKETEIKNGPSKGYHTISVGKRGQVIEIIGYFGNWAKVKMTDKNVGYFYIEN